MNHVRRNYSLIRKSFEAAMLQDMDAAVTKANMWDWLKMYEPPADKGFMWDNHPNISIISSKLEHDGHSGASFAWTLRNIQFVAQNGWDKYCEVSALAEARAAAAEAQQKVRDLE
jgi:hypothetical protein